MGFQYTEEQKKVIDTKGRNILVSAAAGSGKTAVLVERIIQGLISRRMDLSSLLVVTFTKAAAAEMRERIREALYDGLEDHPHLREQLALLQGAHITTLHSFCYQMIRQHYLTLGLEPGFQIGDDTRLTILKEGLLDDLLEAAYQEARPAFVDLVESFAGGKQDAALGQLIFSLHGYSQAAPWPDAWLDTSIENYAYTTVEAFLQSPLAKGIHQALEVEFKQMADQLDQLKDLFNQPAGPLSMKDQYDYYQGFLDSVQGQALSKKVFAAIQAMGKLQLSRKRKGMDPGLLQEAKDLVAACRQTMDKLQALGGFDLEEEVAWMEKMAPRLKELIRLVKVFESRYQAAKKDKNLIDFNDIEHFAIDLLYSQSEDQGLVYSSVARSYQKTFSEVMVDEYQDTNLVQETILLALSREKTGKPNRFMVGDMKQSIYKFRLARPELFAEKYQTYGGVETPYARIDLQKNFRSRNQVLAFTNFIFESLMTGPDSDLQYDDQARLVPGATWFSKMEETVYLPDIHLLDYEAMASQGEDPVAIESQFIVHRIQQVMASALPVYDKDLGRDRPIRYGDIAVLMRSPSPVMDTLLEAFKKEKVPVLAESVSGYFETVEIRLMVALLKVIDNPMDDIALAAVLRSPIVGLTGYEMAEIKSQCQEESLYESLLMFIDLPIQGDGVSDQLASQIRDFLTQREDWVIKSQQVKIYELIDFIYETTHLDTYVASMPGGAQRQANLNHLKQEAIQYEKDQYEGIFSFLKRIEKIQKYDIKTGEPMLSSSAQGRVRLVSIHKSKGLEYPVVCLGFLGKQMNKQDLRQRVLLHQDLGLGSDYIDYEARYRQASIIKERIKRQLHLELINEEKRILYVALTRAKEKLILTGTVKKLEKKMDKWDLDKGERSDQTYLDLFMPLVLDHPEEEGRLYQLAVEEEGLSQALDQDRSQHYQERKKQVQDLLSQTSQTSREAYFYPAYPYLSATQQETTVSVSQLKKEAMTLHIEESKEAYLPKQGGGGAQAGSLYHKLLHLLPLDLDPDAIEAWLFDQVQGHRISQEEMDLVQPAWLKNFLLSPPIGEMIEADRKGQLKKEQPFVYGVEKTGVQGLVMVQGIIDLYYLKDGGLVLVDYKTDRVVGKQELIGRYKEQIFQYKQALEGLMPYPVVQTRLYSLYLNQWIDVQL